MKGENLDTLRAAATSLDPRDELMTTLLTRSEIIPKCAFRFAASVWTGW